MVICVCVLHSKPFFLPVDTQHNQCPCRFFNPRRDASFVVTKTEIQRYYVATYAVSTVDEAMPCHHTGYDTVQDIYCRYHASLFWFPFSPIIFPHVPSDSIPLFFFFGYFFLARCARCASVMILLSDSFVFVRNIFHLFLFLQCYSLTRRTRVTISCGGGGY